MNTVIETLRKGGNYTTHGRFFSIAAVCGMFAWSCYASFPCFSAEAARPDGAHPRKPNVVLVMTDDQGYGDMSCHGNQVLKTPAIDALYADGVRLTDFHVDPCCSPTRAALMTGRYSTRVGVWHTVLGKSLLRSGETTMAEVFAANGYRTGMFGKWHLGDSFPFRPNDRGFQEALFHGGGAIGNSPDYWGNDYFDDTYFRNGKPEKFNGYCTDVWFQQAIRFIRANQDRPFFCYLPANVPHWPLRVDEKYVKPFAGKVPDSIARFYGMLANFDENLAKLRRELRKLGLEENTIFIFLTDNGTADGVELDEEGYAKSGFNAGMKGQKIWEYEGGHRVPCFIYWPAGGIGGGRDVSRLTAHIDLLPTLIDLCGLSPPPHGKFDGVSLAPLLKNSVKAAADWPDRTLFVHNQRVIDPVKGKNFEVMTDRWRLVNGRELYEIKSDPGQHHNAADQHPNVMAALQKAYDRWWADISTDFDKPARMVIGDDRANPTTLYTHDWIGRPHELFDQSQVRRGRLGNLEYQGHWLIEIARDGRYEIEFRRWPRELNRAITAGIEGGTALPATQAKLRIGAVEQTKPIAKDVVAVTFSVDLKAGPTTLEGWFSDEPSGISRGPFYVYARRIVAHSNGLHGYIGFSAARPPALSEYSAGMGFYSAVWPLIDQPLANFQIGLAGCWIMPDNSDNKDTPLAPKGTLARTWKERAPTWAGVFQTIEGGLGYWAGNHYRYGPPKFSMNATPQCYDYEIGSPGWSFFYSNEALPDNRLGIAQLSNRLLIPPDALPFQGNPNGQFLGYTWMALPFTDSTSGDPPTGDQSWTCFLSAANFKGPIAYYIPETWSKIGKLFNDPFLYGRGLDARPGVMGGGAMEINTVPCFESQDARGVVYTKIPKLRFPVDDQGKSFLVQDVTYYSKKALYDGFKAWRDGGPACSGQFDKKGEWKSALTTHTTRYDQGGKKITGVEQVFDTKVYDGNVWGLKWFSSDISPNGSFPQYFKHVGQERVAVAAADVPAETGLLSREFKLARSGVPYTSPTSGAWTRPGPQCGPFTVKLVDGSTVTYHWYRFIDQPSFQQYDWSEEKKAKLQALVEKIHATWPIDRDYMAPPSRGALAALDPALLVTPPKGFEVGYVPIVTGQKMPK